jgi:hypothetical protein
MMPFPPRRGHGAGNIHGEDVHGGAKQPIPFADEFAGLFIWATNGINP